MKLLFSVCVCGWVEQGNMRTFVGVGEPIAAGSSTILQGTKTQPPFQYNMMGTNFYLLFYFKSYCDVMQ